MIVKSYPLDKLWLKVWQSRLSSILGKILVCLSILQVGLSSPSQSADLDGLKWARAFTNLCLQEAYSKPNAVETLYFFGQTANSVCGCGGELMGATLTVAETEFYSVNKTMRGDTKMRWRKGLVQCMNRAIVPPATRCHIGNISLTTLSAAWIFLSEKGFIMISAGTENSVPADVSIMTWCCGRMRARW